MRARRAGFTLLEVMVALAILVVSLAILAETQATAALASREAENLVTATALAQEKLSEVMLLVEEEGFTDREITEEGDFHEFGDDATDLEFGAALDDYHWRYEVVEIDLGIAGDVMSMAEGYSGDESSPVSTDQARAAATADGQAPGLDSLGISNDFIMEYLARYIRHVEVTVWWGDDFDDAEERGDVIVITGHVINPEGTVRDTSGEEPT